MKYIGIFVNRTRDVDLFYTREVVRALQSRGKTVLLDEDYSGEANLEAEFVSHKKMLETAQMIIALGGDGTILKIIGDAAEHNIPVVGINLGHLGFLTQAEKDEVGIFDEIASGEFSVNQAMMLEARVYRDGKVVSKHLALNEMVVKDDGGKMLSIQVEVDGTVTNKYLADGIITATSTGSTAYSLSCGGPIVHHDIDCILLTPVCPHTLKARCVIIPPTSTVVLRVDAAYSAETNLKADGCLVSRLGEGDYIEIVQAEKTAPLVTLNSRNYFDVIREKLSD